VKPFKVSQQLHQSENQLQIALPLFLPATLTIDYILVCNANSDVRSNEEKKLYILCFYFLIDHSVIEMDALIAHRA